MTIQTQWGALLDAQVPFVGAVFPRNVEKRFMNPIRYKTNYRLLPGCLAICGMSLILGLALMELDEQKYLPAFLVLLGVSAAVCMAMLCAVPKMRKRELEIERKRYNFDYSGLEDCESYEFEYEGGRLKLTKEGMYYQDKFHWYGHVRPRLATSNMCNRIWLAIQFGKDPITAVFLHLEPKVLKAVKTLQIPLENAEMLEYLLKYPENAMAQIYNYSSFKVFDMEDEKGTE